MKKLVLVIAVFAALLLISAFAAEERVIYLADGGSGDGSSALSPLGSLAAAYSALGDDGGTIVVSGEYTVTTAFVSPAHSGRVALTSVFGGTDYRKTAGAAFVLKANYYIGGETVIDGIKIVNSGEYKGLFANYKRLTVGSDVVCDFDESVTDVYPSIVAGTYVAVDGALAEVDIYSGTWQRIRLGNSSASVKNADVDLTIHGGECREIVYLSGVASHSGDVTLTVNGGRLMMGIFGTSMSSASHTFDGSMSIVINGGDIRGRIRPQYTKYGSLKGEFNVVINGGDFSHLAELVGTASISDTMTSSISFGEGVDTSLQESGRMTFTNPLRYYGADPWLFYHDGCYYYTTTAGNTLTLYKAANIGDLAVAAGTVIYDPEDGKEWSCNMWSPEIHYFGESEVGKENAGWYCYVGSDAGDDLNYSGQRAYVIKCLDGDNLMGRWGHPVTGEVNVPQKVLFPDSDYNENELCGGCSKLVIDGKAYITFVSEVGRDTDNFYQTLNIAEMENPWTLVGTPTKIAEPTYDWEKVGGGDGIHPYTVECTTAVYGKDGSIYLAYAGSAYWTSWYAVGQIKYLGGDPMQAGSWQKFSEPLFSKSGEVTGSAHACFVTDTEGNGWACYHGYVVGSSLTGRYAFVEPYTVTAEGGLVIGNGTGHPAPLSTVYDVAINPTPLFEKVSGFTEFAAQAESTVDRVSVSFGSIDGADSYRVYRSDALVAEVKANRVFDAAAPVGDVTYRIDAVDGEGEIVCSTDASCISYVGMRYTDLDSDGDTDLADALRLIKGMLDGSIEASVKDVLRILKCI